MSEDNDQPKAKAYRTVIRSARFTLEEWAAVEQRADTARLSPSRFLRFTALGTPLGRRVDAEAVVALNRLGVVLNNAVRLALRSGQPLVADEIKQVLDQLRERLGCFL
jgi:mobilization protein NikA